MIERQEKDHVEKLRHWSKALKKCLVSKPEIQGKRYIGEPKKYYCQACIFSWLEYSAMIEGHSTVLCVVHM